MPALAALYVIVSNTFSFAGSTGLFPRTVPFFASTVGTIVCLQDARKKFASTQIADAPGNLTRIAFFHGVDVPVSRFTRRAVFRYSLWMIPAIPTLLTKTYWHMYSMYVILYMFFGQITFPLFKYNTSHQSLLSIHHNTVTIHTTKLIYNACQ